MKFELPIKVRNRLASHDHRLQHLLWHSIRNNWGWITAAERKAFKTAHPDWAPNIARFNGTPDQPQVNYEAGESFLYMHRQMIKAVNEEILASGGGKIVGWPTIPTPDDTDYPVPDKTGDINSSNPKSDEMFAELTKRITTISDEKNLKKISLAKAGAYVESFIHDLLHMRFADVPGAMSGFPDDISVLQLDPKIDPALFDPSIDWLGHPFSSHVNSAFWKLHGWVDSIPERWMVAQGKQEIEWTDTWQGGMATHHMPMPGGPGGLPFSLDLGPGIPLSPHHRGADELNAVLKSVAGFSVCVVGFDYLQKFNLQAPEL